MALNLEAIGSVQDQDPKTSGRVFDNSSEDFSAGLANVNPKLTNDQDEQVGQLRKWTADNESSECLNTKNIMFKELLNFEKKYVVSSLSDRRKSNKADGGEELREVMGEVKNIEGAMLKCCEIAKFAIEKYDNIVGKHQHMMIDYDGVQQ